MDEYLLLFLRGYSSEPEANEHAYILVSRIRVGCTISGRLRMKYGLLRRFFRTAEHIWKKKKIKL